MNMPLAEILDRISILRLKIERIGERHLKYEYETCLQSLDWHIRAGGVSAVPLIGLLFDLYLVNRQIWDLEAELKGGKEGTLTAEEIARRAIAIRDLNRRRVSLKSAVVDITGLGFKDVKANHASEEPK